jgi:hypothetical protein
MSAKPKYSVVTTQTIDSFEIAVMSRGRNAAICYSVSMARKIARALNAMEAGQKKPKAKPFQFDWTGIPAKFKFAAMDKPGYWYAYDKFPIRPKRDTDGIWPYANTKSFSFMHPRYPGDWRDSLQKRPQQKNTNE